jgi:ASPIC and UnbV/FG-GAP-like repeat
VTLHDLGHNATIMLSKPLRQELLVNRWSASILLVLLSLGGQISCSSSMDTAHGYDKIPLQIAHYSLFDVGVSDINSDSLLDIFTSNHSSPQSVLLNNGKGEFSDAFSSLHLEQDQRFPGFASLEEEPTTTGLGLFINWVGPNLIVRTKTIAGMESVSGIIEVLSSVALIQRDHFEVTVNPNNAFSGVTRTTVEFSGQGDGFFVIRPHIHALPITFKLAPPLTPSQIYLGPKQITPQSREFTFLLRDRHGMAWADYNADEAVDLFITRGGLKGLMRKTPYHFWDELLLRGKRGFTDIGVESGFSKDGCPGRQVAWIDYDGDGLLDVYIACGRRGETHPNRLYKQQVNGHFIEVSNEVGLDINSVGSFLWLDFDSDGDMDLFWAGREEFSVFKNEQHKFVSTYLVSNPSRSVGIKLSATDFDNDLDLDVFAASPGGNLLFVNAKGIYTPVDPARFGLPAKSLTANWVDYDNDGLQDLHTIPGGLVRQLDSGQFISTGLLDADGNTFSLWRMSNARCSWFDIDNDGRRDILVALEYTPRKRKWLQWIWDIRNSIFDHKNNARFWNVSLFRNNNKKNHWLQVKLVGPRGNRPAIGARVLVGMANRTQVRQVGSAEGSHYSQGHYRMYFGLGQESSPKYVRVIWPDGRIDEIERPKADQLLVVKWQANTRDTIEVH